MADEEYQESEVSSATAALPAPTRARPKLLPPYKVILHNDDENTIEHAIRTILMLTPLSHQDAIERTIEAHTTGCALLLVTHRERAELYEEQFRSASLIVTVEPDE